MNVTTTPVNPANAVAAATMCSTTDAFTTLATSYKHGGSWRGVGGCLSTNAPLSGDQKIHSLIATTLVAPVVSMSAAAAAASKRRMVNKTGKGSSPWRFPV